jgi:hypothetical protein
MTRARAFLLLNPLFAGVLLLAGSAARADDASDCQAAAGTYLSGVVHSKPSFARGSRLHGIELSHTHIKLVGDADGQTYDIAVDDVFASGYKRSKEGVPPPLDEIKTGDHLSLCGIPYKGGMHWVHTNCGDTPTAQDPNGWLKEIGADGSDGPNLEGSTTYCYLWPKH